MLGRVFKRLDRVFVLQHGPCSTHQPRYLTISLLFPLSGNIRNLVKFIDKIQLHQLQCDQQNTFSIQLNFQTFTCVSDKYWSPHGVECHIAIAFSKGIAKYYRRGKRGCRVVIGVSLAQKCIQLDTGEQPPEVFCKKGCSQKFRKIHRKTPVSESLF